MARILIVDDETNYRVLLRACLERAGHEVLDLARGAEVLELACARRPDAILLDFDLPDGFGPDVCRSLKANAAAKTDESTFCSRTKRRNSEPCTEIFRFAG